jgi:hypothetical protein
MRTAALEFAHWAVPTARLAIEVIANRASFCWRLRPNWHFVARRSRRSSIASGVWCGAYPRSAPHLWCMLCYCLISPINHQARARGQLGGSALLISSREQMQPSVARSGRTKKNV